MIEIKAMPRKKQTQAKAALSPHQYDIMATLADRRDQSLADYIRALIAEDATRHGIDWPDEIKHGDPSRFPHVAPEH